MHDQLAAINLALLHVKLARQLGYSSKREYCLNKSAPVRCATERCMLPN